MTGLEPSFKIFAVALIYIGASEGQAKYFIKPAAGLIYSGFDGYHLPPKTVGAVVDNLRASGCRPRFMGLFASWS